MEDANLYIGNVSLEDIEEFEDNALTSEIEEERRKSFLQVETSTETELYDGNISPEDIKEFEDSCSTQANKAFSRVKLEVSKPCIGHIRFYRKQLEHTHQLDHRSEHVEKVVKQGSYGAHQVEANPEGISLQDIQQFEETTSASDDVREHRSLLPDGDDALDVILREALEDYESSLSPKGD